MGGVPLGSPEGTGELNLHREPPSASSACPAVLGHPAAGIALAAWSAGKGEGRSSGTAQGRSSPPPFISILLNTMSVNSSAVIVSLQRLMDRMAWRERGRGTGSY